jgi:vacuolar-type H+-ATPase subunit C/Vma6
MGTYIDYSYINARIHGLISKLLSEAQFSSFDRTGSITEVLHLLRSGSYKNLAEIYNKTGDIKMIELELFQYHRRVFSNLKKHSPESLESVIDAFSLKLDFDTIKNALRLWFDQRIRKRPISEFIAYIPEDITWNGVSPHQIINTGTKKELESTVVKAGFKDDIPDFSEELETVFRDSSLFYLELAVDKGFYIKLLSKISVLGSRDYTILFSLIGKEIDVRNITRFLRFPELFTEIPASWPREKRTAHIEKIVIPGGSRFSVKDFESAVLKGFSMRPSTGSGSTEKQGNPSDSGSGIISMINRSDYIHIDEFTAAASSSKEMRRRNQLKTLLQIEHSLQNHLLKSAKKSKLEDPFSIGTLAAYLILKEREITRVRSLINAKYYGLKLMDFETGQRSEMKENKQP